MRAFHGDPAIKIKYLARVDAHIAADELIHGIGWNGEKGCAVGCTLESYDHNLYPFELGIPKWLARAEDTLFENISKEKSKTFPRDFLASINCGADLEQCKGPFLIVVLRYALTCVDADKFPEVISALNGSIALWQRSDVGSPGWNKEAAAALQRAGVAASATDAEAPAAARAAQAARWLAAQAARGEAEAAEAVAWAIWGTREKARTEASDYFADELLRSLAECPPFAT